MQTFTKFLYDFLSQFFTGAKTIIFGIWEGIKQAFNFAAYSEVINEYKGDLSMPEWVLVGLAVLMILALIAMFVLLIYFLVRKYIKFRKKGINQEELLEEVASLNKQVVTLMKEKDEIMAMKVSQLGLKPGESPIEEQGDEASEEDEFQGEGIRFAKLTEIDGDFKSYKVKDYANSYTLEELCENFRNFAASKLKLYYSLDMIRLFIAALSSTKLVILQGISGTGKTSLAYAWGKFLKHDSCVASVQPSWRDRTELFRIF